MPRRNRREDIRLAATPNMNIARALGRNLLGRRTMWRSRPTTTFHFVAWALGVLATMLYTIDVCWPLTDAQKIEPVRLAACMADRDLPWPQRSKSFRDLERR